MNCGERPLSDRPSAHMPSQFGNLIFRHGAAFYNFEGLRRFKNKFRPDWQPRYVALPPGVSPYLEVVEVAMLISGGARNLIAKD
ncbi:phosphatidylglycerol lysyltransferase domain-containing protein [uncultured Thioclava sp.]|uniref:phosphatidylglycerol lysyltransferase domain-containing protein n=1 Tax=uncultured Thioclava sp. TaxID=473858 RepID=UPI0025DA3A0D|nr:phosphatidylglycerol lysyltransferase domain-containing protein [uncultured Thioclava sp.]